MGNKAIKASLLGLFMIWLVFMIGCQKVLDYVHLPGNGDVDYKICNILNVTAEFQTEIENYPVQYKFTYNAQRNPVSVKNDFVTTGNPNLLFLYDKHNRLIQLIRPYENGGFETWDKYGYNTKNQIARDTQYIFGGFVDSIPSLFPNQFRYVNYEYDGQNRIIMRTDSIFHPDNTLAVITHESYNYDARGNLLSSGVTYDNKVNIRRTNKIWMFITNDYSVNNPFIATSYNAHGLPVVFSSANIVLDGIVPLSGKTVVEYSCI